MAYLLGGWAHAAVATLLFALFTLNDLPPGPASVVIFWSFAWPVVLTLCLSLGRIAGSSSALSLHILQCLSF